MTSPLAPSIVTVSASIPSYMSVWYMAPPLPSGFRSQLGFDRLAFDQPETAASFHRLERREVAESRRLNLTVRLIVTPWMIILAELKSLEGGTPGDRPQGRSGTVGEGEAEEGSERGVSIRFVSS